MNVANLENCRKLHELSGWDGHTNEWWYHNAEANSTFTDKNPSDYQITEPIAPAYDLGYLMRKLEGYDVSLSYSNQWRRWTAWGHDNQYSQHAGAPEDAACKLAVELIKQGVLNPKEDNHGE